MRHSRHSLSYCLAINFNCNSESSGLSEVSVSTLRILHSLRGVLQSVPHYLAGKAPRIIFLQTLCAVLLRFSAILQILCHAFIRFCSSNHPCNEKYLIRKLLFLRYVRLHTCPVIGRVTYMCSCIKIFVLKNTCTRTHAILCMEPCAFLQVGIQLCIEFFMQATFEHYSMKFNPVHFL